MSDDIVDDLRRLIDESPVPPLVYGGVQTRRAVAYLMGPGDEEEGELAAIPPRTLRIFAVSHELLRQRVESLEAELRRRGASRIMTLPPHRLVIDDDEDEPAAPCIHARTWPVEWLDEYGRQVDRGLVCADCRVVTWDQPYLHGPATVYDDGERTELLPPHPLALAWERGR
jgi:hypothetical protein